VSGYEDKIYQRLFGKSLSKRDCPNAFSMVPFCLLLLKFNNNINIS